MKNYISILLLSILLTGCTDLNKYSLFSNKQELTTIVTSKPQKNEIYRYKIKPYDRISVLFYDHPDISTRKIGDFQEDTVGILIDANGVASFPLIGDIKVTGMYIEDLENEIEKRAAEFIINPSVNLNIINHRLFVLGEVNRPGTVKITNTTMNLFEAISSSGGLRDTSNKNEILIIRGDLSNPELIKVDLTSFQSLSHTNLTLQPYDILYINPNKAKNFNITVGELFPFIQLIQSAVGSGVDLKTLN